jgi:hypothetical protein
MSVEEPSSVRKCDRCGTCCRTLPCGIAYLLLGQEKGPCPALEQGDDGFACGLILHPSCYLDLGADPEWKDEVFGQLFGEFLGIGWGCCRSPLSEESKRRMRSLQRLVRGPQA